MDRAQPRPCYLWGPSISRAKAQQQHRAAVTSKGQGQRLPVNPFAFLLFNLFSRTQSGISGPADTSASAEGTPARDPRAARPPRSAKGLQKQRPKFSLLGAWECGSKQEPGSTRAASRHHTRAHAGQDTLRSRGSPSASPGTAQPVPHREGGHSQPGGMGHWGVSPQPPSPTLGSGVALPAPRFAPGPAPCPPPPLTPHRAALGARLRLRLRLRRLHSRPPALPRAPLRGPPRCS